MAQTSAMPIYPRINNNNLYKSQPDAQTARLVAELERMRRVVAEITAENLELKKRR